MHKFIKVISTLLVLTLLFSCFVFPANAQVTSDQNNTDSALQGEGQIAIIHNIGSSNQQITPYAYGTTIISVSIYRQSPSSEVCQFYFNWNGTLRISGIRWSKIEIESTSWLFPKLYHEWPYGMYPYMERFDTSSNGYVWFANFRLPTNVDKVRVTVSDLYVYSVDDAAWRSGPTISNTVAIS